ncbi:outer membrane beta-barrel protein [Hymenobacter psychrophilus]|uniref:Outer membrane protein beta-barrel domain-containing protein n=1 Tax=Hymenobacter psychrophilus TaxID=651662 RepID=A0A1H3AUZ8_9BACT|nr:outer membrane beta-barrel protein [Hymenobacter psychrophilus]SDX33552.1 Outer membrane protein beta-barrel domain-containing protein [Hymenobacter psychrophilus]
MFKLLCCSLLALPLAASAQTSGTASFTPKVYVGLGVNAGRYYDKRVGYPLSSDLIYSPSIIAGIRLLPSLALQLSATTYDYRRQYTAPINNYAQDPNNPIVGYVSGTTKRRYYVLPLLARYTFKNNSQRARFDALAGASIYHSREQSTTTLSDTQNRITDRYDYSRTGTYASLLLGAGLRYAIAPRLEAASELRANVFYFGYSGAIDPNLEISLRYCFGKLATQNASATSSLPGK